MGIPWFKNIGIILGGGLLFLGQVKAIDCPDDDLVARWLSGYPSQWVSDMPAFSSLEEAYCAQAKFVALLATRMGEVVGYKVAFTGKATQKQLGITTPAFGVLFSEMFLPDGARISSDYGLRPFIEPDLMVVVKDEGLMDATTEIEVAAHLSSVHALMELTSLPFPVEEAVNGSALVALNLMATYMVMGPGVAVEATPEFVAALAAMETEFTDESGRVIQRSGVSSLMGNPLRVVLWLVAECHRQGRTLRGGDRLSLGAVGRMFPLERGGKTFTYTLNGLPAGALTTSIRVESL